MLHTSAEAEHRTHNRSSARIYIPRTQSELLQLLRRHEEARVYAGGTALFGLGDAATLDIPSTLVALYRVDELRRIARTDRYIDVGANAGIRAVSRVGHSVIPKVLYDCLPHIVPPGLRTLATLVGNVCVAGTTMTSVAPLIALGASVEIRRAGGTRWSTLLRFRSSEGPLLQPGEVVTRLRIPLQPWDVQAFRTTEDSRLRFACLARRNKGSLESVRIVLATRLPEVIHDRELEAELAGRKLPLGNRDVEFAADKMKALLRHRDPAVSNFDTYRVEQQIRWFLHSLTRA